MLTVPGLCWLCQMPLRCPSWGLCCHCIAALPAAPSCCPCCGLPCTNPRLLCGRCLQKTPSWDALVFVADYLTPLTGLIHQFKFNGVTALAPALARLMVLSILQARREQNLPRVDTLISVPLHHWRAWRRGFNQSSLLAEPLAHWLGLDYQTDAIKRIRATPVQHQLNARQRRNNLRGAFRVDFPVSGRHIAIVDDVVTTGSTVAEIARLLTQRGAATVQIWCLCRTL